MAYLVLLFLVKVKMFYILLQAMVKVTELSSQVRSKDDEISKKETQ